MYFTACVDRRGPRRARGLLGTVGSVSVNGSLLSHPPTDRWDRPPAGAQTGLQPVAAVGRHGCPLR